MDIMAEEVSQYSGNTQMPLLKQLRTFLCTVLNGLNVIMVFLQLSLLGKKLPLALSLIGLNDRTLLNDCMSWADQDCTLLAI